MCLFNPSGTVNLTCAIKCLCSKIFPLLLPSSQFVTINRGLFCTDYWELEEEVENHFSFQKKNSVVFKPDSLSKDIEI